MLISEEIEIGVGNNLSYYESLGYIIPKYIDKSNRLKVKKGTKIFVKSEDISKGSHIVVRYFCDACSFNDSEDKVFSIGKYHYSERVKEDGRIYCENCTHKLFGGEALRLTRLKSGISFYDWCINTDSIYALKRWDDELNDYSPKDIGHSTNKFKPYFKCQNGLHPSEQKSISSFTGPAKGTINCKQCDLEENSLGNNFPFSFDVWSDKNETTPYDHYKSCTDRVWWKCQNEIHEDYQRDINTTTNCCNFRCPKCERRKQGSFLQENISNYLHSFSDFIVNHEYECDLICRNPNNNYILPYDNEVINNNFRLIIETHGKQHFTINSWHILAAKNHGTTPETELEYMQWKDEIKMNYALDNGYFYLAIPYTADDKNETYKIMIDDMLNFIHENI